MPGGAAYVRLRQIVETHKLHTVCASAKCPNLGECWQQGIATIMILGDVCTRSCGFCHVLTGRPGTLDLDEPRRVAESVALMNLNHVVITSVNRDELPDGGAEVWAQTILAIRKQTPAVAVEVLIPDFCGDWDALQTVMDARPEILNHNMETVASLYQMVRPQAKYDRSLELLARAKAFGLTTKTGIMVGLGETDEQVEQLMRDVVEQAHCDMLTIGQYLQPSAKHLPVARWVKPEQFVAYKQRGEALGLRHVEAGPMVRSSYHAATQASTLGVGAAATGIKRGLHASA
jgi:lipoic acid synthetase